MARCVRISKDRLNGCFGEKYFTRSGFEEDWFVNLCGKEASIFFFLCRCGQNKSWLESSWMTMQSDKAAQFRDCKSDATINDSR